MLLNSLLYALGLAFESFMVAMANGLYNANFGAKKAMALAVLFALCHAAELLLGFLLMYILARSVPFIEGIIVWISAAVLGVLGIKMIAEGALVAKGKQEKPIHKMGEFVVQSVVAAFDAFAVGLTASDYSVLDIFICASIITVVIVAFYIAGFVAGKKCEAKFGKYSAVLGGLVFIGLAIEVIVGALI